jgi:hypothetical protein
MALLSTKPCEDYQVAFDPLEHFVSVPDCCFWSSSPCQGCPYLLSGKPGTTTQCISRQFPPNVFNMSVSCSQCSPGYTKINIGGGPGICCNTSDKFDDTLNSYCATVSPCICKSTEVQNFPNPVAAPPVASLSYSPLQCIQSCYSKLYSTLGTQASLYVNFGGTQTSSTCILSYLHDNQCPIETHPEAYKSRSMIQDAVCDIPQNFKLTNVGSSTLIASELGIASIKADNAKYYMMTILCFAGLALLVLGYWGKRKYNTTIL